MLWRLARFSVTSLEILGLLSPVASPARAATAVLDDPPYERSVKMVIEALERFPGDAALTRVLGDVHFRRGRFEDAVASFREARRLDPRFVEVLFSEAAGLEQLAREAEAIAVYRKVLSLGGRGFAIRARQALADIYSGRGELQLAVEELRAAVKEGAGGAGIHYRLGKALLGSAAAWPGKRDTIEIEAIEALTRATAIDRSHAAAHYALAMVWKRRGKLDLARQSLEAYRRSHRPKSALDPEELRRSDATFEARTAVQVARALFRGGRAEEALEYSRRALELDGGLVEAMACQGWIHMNLGRTQEAAASFDRVLAVDPGHAEALWNLGKLRLKENRPREAAPLILKCMEGRPGFAEGWELLFQMAKGGVFGEQRAEEFARKALRARPSATNHVRLAMLLFESGRLSDCERILLDGLKLHPRSEELHQGMAALKQAVGGAR